jgi:diguanylate cyclase (GGDEF)-like protein
MLSPSDGPFVDVVPYRGFAEAARGVTAFLHATVGLDLWLVTQVRDDRQVAVAASPATVVQPGMNIPWAEGFCTRMADGRGPRVAAVTAAVPAYAGLSFSPAFEVNAYLGVPIVRADGALLGTLCGFGSRPQPATLADHLPLVEQTARLLATVLDHEGAVVARQRTIERVIADSERDVLTGLLNRRGWERALAAEEARCARSGLPATVIVLDLDGLKQVNDSAGHAAGDDLLRRTAEVLQEDSRPTDVLARLGGDEFAVLVTATGSDPDDAGADAYVARLSGRLTAAEVPVSLGYAPRTGGLVQAWHRADAAMYDVKARRRLPR